MSCIAVALRQALAIQVKRELLMSSSMDPFTKETNTTVQYTTDHSRITKLQTQVYHLANNNKKIYNLKSQELTLPQVQQTFPTSESMIYEFPVAYISMCFNPLTILLKQNILKWSDFMLRGDLMSL